MIWNAVIFDRDGTLFDSFPVILAAFNYAIEPYNTKRPTDAEWFQAFGPAEPEVIGKFIPEGKKEEASQRFYRYYHEHLDQIRLFEGMKSVLETLKQNG